MTKVCFSFLLWLSLDSDGSESGMVDNQYIAVGLSSPLSKSSFILFILGVFRTSKAR